MNWTALCVTFKNDCLCTMRYDFTIRDINAVNTNDQPMRILIDLLDTE
jgi:hypothetical protein